MSYLIFNDVVSIYAPRPPFELKEDVENQNNSIANYIYSNILTNPGCNNILRTTRPNNLYSTFEKLLWDLVRDTTRSALTEAYLGLLSYNQMMKGALYSQNAKEIVFFDDMMNDTILSIGECDMKLSKSRRCVAPIVKGYNIVGEVLKNISDIKEKENKVSQKFMLYRMLKILEKVAIEKKEK